MHRGSANVLKGHIFDGCFSLRLQEKVPAVSIFLFELRSLPYGQPYKITGKEIKAKNDTARFPRVLIIGAEATDTDARWLMNMGHSEQGGLAQFGRR